MAMPGIWKTLVVAFLALPLTAGCRTPQPNLKPDNQPEVLTKPPSEARFNSSQYPDLAYRDMNDRFRKSNDSGGGNPMLATRGSPMAGPMGSSSAMGGGMPR